MLEWKTLTGLVIVGAIAGLIVYDLIANALGGSPATISRFMYYLSAVAPYLPYAFVFSLAVLCGHLFWAVRTGETLFGMWGFWAKLSVTAAAGILFGRVFLPQHVADEELTTVQKMGKAVGVSDPKPPAELPASGRSE